MLPLRASAGPGTLASRTAAIVERQAALYPVVLFGPEYHRLERHYYASSTINRMPGPGTQTSTYLVILLPGAVGSRGGDILEPTAVDIFPGERRMYRPTTNKTGATPLYAQKKRNTPKPALRRWGRERGRGTHLLLPLLSAKMLGLLWKYTMGAYTGDVHISLFLRSIHTIFPDRRGILLSRQREEARRGDGGRGCSR